MQCQECKFKCEKSCMMGITKVKYGVKNLGMRKDERAKLDDME